LTYQSLFPMIAGLVMVASAALVRRRMLADKPPKVDFRDWDATARANGWSVSVFPSSCRLLARIDGVRVVANGVGSRKALPDDLPWWQALFSAPPEGALVVASSVTATVIDARFTVRKREIAEIATPDPVLDDRELTSSLVFGGDAEAATVAIAKPGVRASLLRLTRRGAVSVSDGMVLVASPQILSSADLLQAVRDVAVVAAAIGAPELGDAPIRPPRLAGLVRQVIAGAQAPSGNAPGSALAGKAVSLEFEVERIHLRHGLADGSDGVTLEGHESRATTRVAVGARPPFEVLRDVRPGVEVHTTAMVESYDARSDSAELQATGAMSVVKAPAASSAATPDGPPSQLGPTPPAASTVDAEAPGDLGTLLHALAAAGTRTLTLLRAARRGWAGEFTATHLEPTPARPVPPAVRGGARWVGHVDGVAVELLTPPDAPPPAGRVEVMLYRWDEFTARAVCVVNPKPR
jgi:hypothetical protein